MHTTINSFIVIIPARGGSKRFPGKNIYPLNGKPLIAYSIEYVKNFYAQMDIYVSTDSDSISAVANQYGAKIIHRPSELAGDYVSTVTTLKHAVQELIKNNINFDYVILLQPTNPLRPKTLLQDAITIMQTGKYDSLMTISPSDKKFGKIKDNCFLPWNYQYGQRSQDLEPLYYENGLLYISKCEIVLDGLIIGKNMYPMIVDHLYATIDIDSIDDLNYAEFLLHSNLNSEVI